MSELIKHLFGIACTYLYGLSERLFSRFLPAGQERSHCANRENSRHQFISEDLGVFEEIVDSESNDLEWP